MGMDASLPRRIWLAHLLAARSEPMLLRWMMAKNTPSVAELPSHGLLKPGGQALAAEIGMHDHGVEQTPTAEPRLPTGSAQIVPGRRRPARRGPTLQPQSLRHRHGPLPGPGTGRSRNALPSRCSRCPGWLRAAPRRLLHPQAGTAAARSLSSSFPHLPAAAPRLKQPVTGRPQARNSPSLIMEPLPSRTPQHERWRASLQAGSSPRTATRAACLATPPASRRRRPPWPFRQAARRPTGEAHANRPGSAAAAGRSGRRRKARRAARVDRRPSGRSRRTCAPCVRRASGPSGH